MASRGEDSFTQIQKYKALLSATRGKGGDEMAKKSKKKKKDLSKIQSLDSEAAAASSGLSEVTEDTTLHDANKQNSEKDSITKAEAMTGKTQRESTKTSISLDSNASSQVHPTMSSDKEMNEEPETTIIKKGMDGEPGAGQKEPELERSKKGRLSFRRKKKKSKVTSQESENSAPEKNEEKQQPENPPEENPKTAMNSDIQQNKEPDVSQSEENDEKTASTNGQENKKESSEIKDGKVSRTKKFKRWASFSKQKKDGADVKSTETKQSCDDLELKKVSPDILMRADVENNAQENVHTAGSSKISEFSKEERRKRSVSFAATVEYNDDELLATVEPRARSASFGEETTVLPFNTVTLDDEKIAVNSTETTLESSEQLSETQNESICTTDEPNDSESAVMSVENASNEKNIEDKEVESLSDVEHDIKTDDEYTTACDTAGEEESSPDSNKTKKKKKRFLRKLSSKNIKSKKDSKPLTKEDISSPLELLNSESAANEDASGEQSEEPTEKERKRKKSVFGLKLPKPLKKRKPSNEQQANTADHIDKEIENDEEDENNENLADNANIERSPIENTNDNPPEKTEDQQHPEESLEKETDHSNALEVVYKEQSELCEAIVTGQKGQQPEYTGDDNKEDNMLVSNEQETNNEGAVKDEENTEILQNEELNNLEEIQQVQSSTPSEIGEIESISSNTEQDKYNGEQGQHQDFVQEDNEIPDSSVSLSEITMLEIGDESSLLAVPISKESAQSGAPQNNIHEVPPTVTTEIAPKEPEITLEQSEVAPEVKLEQQEVTPDQPDVNLEQSETPEQPQQSNAEVEAQHPESSNSIEGTLTPSGESVRENLSESIVNPNVTRSLSPEVRSALRSFEMSVRTKTMVDSYILIDQHLEVSQDFLRQMEMMNNRKNRCFVM